MNKTNTKGFTLIELLVVIAIIGILSTIAMTSLNGARKKAADASFKSSVSSVQAVAVLCCDVGSASINSTAGGNVCSDTSVTGAYPASTSIGTITPADMDTATTGTQSCLGGAFSIKINTPSGFGGTLASGTCTETACTFA